MNSETINYKRLVKVINQDIKEIYGNEFAFELEHEKKYYQVVLEKNYLKFICEYGIIRTPIIFEYSIIDEIIKIIKNLFEMFYLCCYEIRTNVELDIKIVALPQQNYNIL